MQSAVTASKELLHAYLESCAAQHAGLNCENSLLAESL